MQTLRPIDPVRSRSVLLNIVKIFSLFVLLIALSASPPAFAAEQAADVPPWLRAHVGEGEGQIAQVVLQRARALYFQKVGEGVVINPCYFAMDATRPNDLGSGDLGRRFYTICESDRSFRAISVGHGAGRDLKGIADFANGRQCAKNFGNAMDSNLTAGGAYVTGETKTSFKGYYRVSAKQDAVLIRSFVQFDGEGETANARQREIGGHPAEVLKNVCLRKDPRSPYADREGYVPFGTLVDYAGGRSNGCTSWSPSDAGQIIQMMKEKPTTLYIYPESDDIDAVTQGIKAGRSLYEALADSGLFSEEFLQVIATAEEAGSIPEAMRQQARYYQEEAARRLTALAGAASMGLWVLYAGFMIWAIFRIANVYLSALGI